MGYTSFTVKEDKNNDRYRVECTSKYGAWEGGGSFGDLYKCSGFLVLMKHNGRPHGVFRDLNHFCDSIEQQYNIAPKIIVI